MLGTRSIHRFVTKTQKAAVENRDHFEHAKNKTTQTGGPVYLRFLIERWIALYKKKHCQLCY